MFTLKYVMPCSYIGYAHGNTSKKHTFSAQTFAMHTICIYKNKNKICIYKKYVYIKIKKTFSAQTFAMHTDTRANTHARARAHTRAHTSAHAGTHRHAHARAHTHAYIRVKHVQR